MSKEFNVGEEILWKDEELEQKGVITRIDSNKVYIVWDDGTTDVTSHEFLDSAEKTGKEYELAFLKQ